MATATKVTMAVFGQWLSRAVPIRGATLRQATATRRAVASDIQGMLERNAGTIAKGLVLAGQDLCLQPM
jgi:hypothetical protein